MIKTFIVILFTLTIVSSPCLAGEVPFTLEKGFIIIAAKIKKDISVEVAVSTGSPHSYLNPDLILRHKIRLGYTNDGPVTGRNDKIIHFAEVPQVIVGDEKPVSLTMKERSFEAMNKKIGREIGAVLGTDFFKGKIVQIDFKKKVIRFLEKSPIDYKHLKLADATANAQPLFFKMDQLYRTFYAAELTLPVVEGITFNGEKIRALFDTGSAFPVLMSPAATKELAFAPVPDKGASKVGQIKLMSLNGYEIPEVPVMLLGKEAGFDESLKQYGAIIGLGIMQNFTLTFDWKEKMIFLEK